MRTRKLRRLGEKERRRRESRGEQYEIPRGPEDVARAQRTTVFPEIRSLFRERVATGQQAGLPILKATGQTAYQSRPNDPSVALCGV